MKYSFLICITKLGEVEKCALDSVVFAVESYNQSKTSKAEVVIVVNGKTPFITKNDLETFFKQTYIKIYTSEIRQLTSNLNIGVNLAEGQYLVRFDSDDVCMADRLFRLDDLLSEYSNFPDLIAGSALYIKDNKSLLIKPLPLEYVLKAKSPFIHPALTIKRETLIELGGYMGLQYAQDYELALRCYDFGCSYVIDDNPHIKYICGEGQKNKRIQSLSMQLSYIYQRLLVNFEIKLFIFFLLKQSKFFLLKIGSILNAK